MNPEFKAEGNSLYTMELEPVDKEVKFAVTHTSEREAPSKQSKLDLCLRHLHPHHAAEVGVGTRRPEWTKQYWCPPDWPAGSDAFPTVTRSRQIEPDRAHAIQPENVATPELQGFAESSVHCPSRQRRQRERQLDAWALCAGQGHGRPSR